MNDRAAQWEWIDTWSGRRFRPFDPRVEDIAIEDIAASLAHQCRFGGHSREFYSVAQHCVHVAELVEQTDPGSALWGLLHDAPEAYLLDLPRPVKRADALAAYREADRRIMVAIAKAFDLPHDLPASVLHADEVLLATEVRDLMSPHMRARLGDLGGTLPEPLRPWGPDEARERFLEKFYILTDVAGVPARERFPSCPAPLSSPARL